MMKSRVARVLAVTSLAAGSMLTAAPAHALSGCSYGLNFSGSKAQGYVTSYSTACRVVVERYSDRNGISTLGSASASPGQTAKTGWYYYDANFYIRACGETYTGPLYCNGWYS